MDTNATTPLTGTTEVPVSPGSPRPQSDDDVRCMACAHPARTHDKISVRYCEATISHALPRGCIC